MRSAAEYPDAHLRVFDRPELPDPADIRDVYLIGICGTGMGTLAGLLRTAGCRVRGSDQAAWPPMSDRLAEQGIRVHEGYDPSHLDPAPDLVVVGNACTPTHVEAAYAREHGLTQASFPETLAHFFLGDRRSIVLAGTHGKTTTTGLVTHLLIETGRDPSCLVGGVVTALGSSSRLGGGPHFVVEGDEYDSAYFDKRPKFMHYRPQVAVVTSMEYDHADIFADMEDYRGAFQAFARTVPEDGTLVLCADHADVSSLAAHTEARVRTYATTPHTAADFTVTNVLTEPSGQHFELIAPAFGLARPLAAFLPMAGRHNLANALGALAAVAAEGVPLTEAVGALGSFAGLKRRQEIRGVIGDVMVIDDFAHHPTAVHETVRAVKAQYPERRLLAVFEPRSNSSRRKVFEAPYLEAFEGADVAIISAPPFRHNDRAEDFMDVARVADTLTNAGVPAFAAPDHDAVRAHLRSVIQPGDTVLVMSNGGFGGLHPWLLAHLNERFESEAARER